MLHLILAFATAFRFDPRVDHRGSWWRDTSQPDRPTRPHHRDPNSGIANRALDGTDLPLIL